MDNPNDVTGTVIGAAIEVHRILGPGLLESVYEECLCRELELRNIPFERQKEVPLKYKGVDNDCGYRLDIVVDRKVLVELKACNSLEPVHEAQLLTYLRLTGIKVGLLINFNVPVLKDGIKRFVIYGAPAPLVRWNCPDAAVSPHQDNPSLASFPGLNSVPSVPLVPPAAARVVK